jgi:hypothetical protein
VIACDFRDDIVFAVKPLVNCVGPVTVPPPNVEPLIIPHVPSPLRYFTPSPEIVAGTRP